MPNSGKRLPAFSADSLLLIHVKLPRSPAHTDHLPSYVRSRQVQTDFQCSASFFLSPSSRHSEPRRAPSSSECPVGSSLNCTPIPLCLENRGFNGMYICVLCTFSLYVKSKQIFSFQKSPLAFIY